MATGNGLRGNVVLELFLTECDCFLHIYFTYSHSCVCLCILKSFACVYFGACAGFVRVVRIHVL